jgi:hypothetical protein
MDCERETKLRLLFDPYISRVTLVFHNDNNNRKITKVVRYDYTGVYNNKQNFCLLLLDITMAEVISLIVGLSYRAPNDDEILWTRDNVNSYFYHQICYNRFFKKRNFSHDKFMNYHLLQKDYVAVDSGISINAGYLLDNDCVFDEKFKIYIPRELINEIIFTLPRSDKTIIHDVHYKVYRLRISPSPNYYDSSDVKPMFAVNVEQNHFPFRAPKDSYVAYDVNFNSFSTAAAGYDVALPKLTRQNISVNTIEIKGHDSVSILFSNVQLKNPKELIDYPDLFLLDKESKLSNVRIRWDSIKSHYNKGMNHFYYLLIKLINIADTPITLENLGLRSGIIFHPPYTYREALYNDFNQTMKYNNSKIFQKSKFSGEIKVKCLSKESDVLWPTNLCQVLNPAHEDLLKPPVHPSITIESILNNPDEDIKSLPAARLEKYIEYIEEIETLELTKSWKRVFCESTADIGVRTVPMPNCYFKCKYRPIKIFPYVSEF